MLNIFKQKVRQQEVTFDRIDVLAKNGQTLVNFYYKGKYVGATTKEGMLDTLNGEVLGISGMNAKIILDMPTEETK